MKTLKQQLQETFIDDRDDWGRIIMSAHTLKRWEIETVIELVKVWLEQDLKDPKLHPIAESYLKGKLEELKQ